jgi:amino acid transporter
VALVFVIWTYGGWTEAAYVAEEVINPVRNIPRAIIGGVALTMVLYLLVNWTYLVWVPMDELVTSKTVAATVMQGFVGPAGAVFMAAMIGCSAFGAVNGYILTGGRILYALGNDHPLFARFGAIHPQFRTPALALWVNAIVAILLVCTKTFDQIATYSTLAITVFFTMAVFAVIILRRRRPDLPRPYRTWGYPVAPWFYGLLMIAFMVNIGLMAPRDAVFGFLFLALGLPLYWWSRSMEPPASMAEKAAA